MSSSLNRSPSACVAQQNTYTCQPASASLATVPPMPSVSSSACGLNTTTTSDVELSLRFSHVVVHLVVISHDLAGRRIEQHQSIGVGRCDRLWLALLRLLLQRTVQLQAVAVTDRRPVSPEPAIPERPRTEVDSVALPEVPGRRPAEVGAVEPHVGHHPVRQLPHQDLPPVRVLVDGVAGHHPPHAALDLP